jgi:hypothetical protein
LLLTARAGAAVCLLGAGGGIFGGGGGIGGGSIGGISPWNKSGGLVAKRESMVGQCEVPTNNYDCPKKTLLNVSIYSVIFWVTICKS